MTKIYFLTFGGPDKKYHDAVNRICKQAEKFNMFEKIIGLTDLDLKADNEFWAKNYDFIEKNSRGYGYWLWKPYLILKTLKTMNDGDILLYLDSGCELNVNGLSRFNDLIKKTKEKLIIGTSSGSNDITWTKKSVVTYLQMENNPKLGLKHMQAGAVMMVKCEKIIKLYEDFYNIASNNYSLIDDSPSNVPNHSSFIEHRHDQSIFNLLVKKHNLYNHDMDPTLWGYYPNSHDYLTKGITYPIWTCRNKTGSAMCPF